MLMRMFPFTAARLKADLQRAACSEVGMHTPVMWQRVVVSAHSPPAADSARPCCALASSAYSQQPLRSCSCSFLRHVL